MSENSQTSNSAWQRLQEESPAQATVSDSFSYGSPAFGLQVVNGERVHHPQEQQIIELIRRHHKSGKSLQQIADWLNGNGYTTKRGHHWQKISVKRVLDRLYPRHPRLLSPEHL
jgi:hypothetical protein